MNIRLLIAVLLALPLSAHATLFWDMHFKNTPARVGPRATFSVPATLYNSNASTEHLGIIGGNSGNPPGFDYEVGAFASIGAIPDQPQTSEEYDVHFGPNGGSFGDQFQGVDLAPGESFDFVFATFTPRNRRVDPGTYSFAAGLQLFKAGTARPMVGVSDDKVFWSVRARPVDSVPEPAPLILLIGVGLALIFRRWVLRDDRPRFDADVQRTIYPLLARRGSDSADPRSGADAQGLNSRTDRLYDRRSIDRRNRL